MESEFHVEKISFSFHFFFLQNIDFKLGSRQFTHLPANTMLLAAGFVDVHRKKEDYKTRAS